MIEVAARLGGGHDAELVELVTGVDLNGPRARGRARAAARCERGRRRVPAERSAARRRGSSSRRPGSSSRSRCRRARSGVVSTRLYREPGSRLRAAPARVSDRAGAVLAVGATPRRGACPGRCGGRAHTLRDGRCRDAMASEHRAAGSRLGCREPSARCDSLRSWPGASRRRPMNRSSGSSDDLVTGSRRLHRLEDRLGQTCTLADASSAGSRCSAFLTVITVPPQAYRWKLLLRARGIEESLVWLTPRLLRLLRRRPGAADGRRRRCLADLRDDAAPSRARARRSPGSVVLERAIGGAVTLVLVGDRVPARDRPLPDRAVPLGRGAVRRRDDRRRLRRLLGAAAPPPAPRRCRSCAGAGRAVVARRSTRGSTATATTPARCSSSPGSRSLAQLSRIARDLGRRPGRRGRARAPALRRARAAALPRDARAVHDQRRSGCARRSSSASSTRLGVSSDAAFATGFIFFLMTLLLALPGLVVILWEGFRRAPVPVADG